VSNHPQTESEKIFEQYLNENDYSNWEFEPPISGCSKRPDYLLRWASGEYLLEVKELHQKGEFQTGARNYDPYSGMRNEIDEARKKFKENGFKNRPCSLVIFNLGDMDAMTGHPQVVFGAMLGDLGFSMKIDISMGEAVPDSEKNGFQGRAKMQPKRNTRINAVIVLQQMAVYDPCYMRDVNRKLLEAEEIKKRPLEPVEALEIQHAFINKFERRKSFVFHLVTHENPHALFPLPEGLFCGTYDERWGIVDGILKLKFRGDGRQEQLSLREKYPTIY